ncbi:MAG: hypothetical protein SO116_08470 [Treponema sp.]|nr:hypothetical protein [Treponema sp.]
MKALRFKFCRALFAALSVVLISAFSFTGCSDPDDSNEAEYLLYGLNGTWYNPDCKGESYTITSETFAAENAYEGNSVVIKATGSSSGYIYFKYTKALEINGSEYSYTENAPDVGKWYAVSFKGLTENTVQISAAYKKGGETSTETLEEAISEFTVENGYFDSYSSLARK